MRFYSRVVRALLSVVQCALTALFKIKLYFQYVGCSGNWNCNRAPMPLMHVKSCCCCQNMLLWNHHSLWWSQCDFGWVSVCEPIKKTPISITIGWYGYRNWMHEIFYLPTTRLDKHICSGDCILGGNLFKLSRIHDQPTVPIWSGLSVNRLRLPFTNKIWTMIIVSRPLSKREELPLVYLQ